MALVVGGLPAPALARAEAAERVRWGELVATVHRQMRSVAGPTADLEDLTQAALEQIVRSLDRFRGEAELTTFTYRVCVNVALNHWRWFRRWFRRFSREEAPEPECPNGDPSELALELERARVLHACLARLSPMQRVVVTLADLEELPASRIAEILECPEPTVRSRLRKARAELSGRLAREPAFGPGAREIGSDERRGDDP